MFLGLKAGILRVPTTSLEFNMETPIYEFGLFCFDARRQILTEGGKRVHVTKKAAQVLKMLVEHAGETVFKEILIDEVWGATGDQGDYLAVKICELRGKRYLTTITKPRRLLRLSMARVTNLSPL
jgi:DNA-binding winged helix-turn-helix (wHTH) protein